MTLVRWNPMQDMMNLRKEMDRIFHGMTDRGTDESYETAVWSPMADITEDSDSYRLHFDVPGMEKNDIKMNFSDGTLTISGERKAESEEKGRTWHRVERSVGRFYRSFTFPTAVDAEKISAAYKNGVLEVRVPKTAESKPKQISIS